MRIKVLIVSTVGLGFDGISNVILSHIQYIDQDKFDISVASTTNIDEQIKKLINEKGISVIELPNRKRNLVKYYVSLAKHIKANGYEVIHAHGNSSTLLIEMLATRKVHKCVRIVHAHSMSCSHKLANLILSPFFIRSYDIALACSKSAGEFLFGNNKFSVIVNGRDIDKYRFCNKNRESVRTQYGIQGLLLGHVGNFLEVKNHRFILEIFRSVLQRCPSAKLMLIGDGPLKSEIVEAAADISEHIFFLNRISNVEVYLSAMDVMILPSFYEGLPLTAIEWQINGLPCIISDRVSKESRLTENVHFLPIHENAKEWADRVIDLHSKVERNSVYAEKSLQQVRSKGFAIEDAVLELQKVYTSSVCKNISDDNI